MRLFYLLWTKVPGKLVRTLVSQRKSVPPATYRRIWGSLFGKYLLLTNTVSSGILMGLGDVMSQEIEYRTQLIDKRYDWKRIGQMFLVGCLGGPFHHVFYKWMDNMLPKADVLTSVKKILLDQAIFSPFCIVTFFYSAGLLETKTLRECNQELREKFLTVYLADWTIWPVAQFLNFYFLPPQYRVLYINVVTMFYNVFLCYVKHTETSFFKFMEKSPQ
ncbi:mpv17-like protein 2 [Phlebotomus argentipes]|uniref:mpv17-like protein 2 n=1 Tax=Phlebotomus argentipes TaxID=94469 RepID=UPI0028934DC2|nr:mpv17-like protein 2 [Phlebotomus argentipes]